MIMAQKPATTVPYTKEALREDLFRLRVAWQDSQESRDRNAIYGYLTALFELVSWWRADGRAVARAVWALRLSVPNPPDIRGPFSALIFCTADQAKVDRRTRSKWTRALRFALEEKDFSEPLDKFVRRHGGINRCAERAGVRFDKQPGHLDDNCSC
jgi:hypothetical protein